jgi:hypothetical protein
MGHLRAIFNNKTYVLLVVAGVGGSLGFFWCNLWNEWHFFDWEWAKNQRKWVILEGFRGCL